jgi:hypothetical protein
MLPFLRKTEMFFFKIVLQMLYRVVLQKIRTIFVQIMIFNLIWRSTKFDQFLTKRNIYLKNANPAY